MILVVSSKPRSKRGAPLPEPAPPISLNPLPEPEGRGKVVPETCQYDQAELPMDSIGCQSRPEARYVFVEGSGYELVQPEPEPLVERPTQAEYIRAFQAAARPPGRRLPRFVVDRWLSADAIVRPVRAVAQACPDHTSRRVQKALATFGPFDLNWAYNPALVARIRHYHERSQERAYASKNLVTSN